MRKWLIASFFCGLISLFLLISQAVADTSQLENTLYQDKTNIVTQQIELLKDRSIQAQNELKKLQRQQDNQSVLTVDRVTKLFLSHAELDIAVAKSNLDSINIELSESQQTVNRLESDIQEINNQLNVYSIFGLKIAHNGGPNLSGLQVDLSYQKNLLHLEKIRASYLQKLQTAANNALQFYKAKYSHIDVLLKSQTTMQLKEKQAKSEMSFQREQSYWLQQLNALYKQLNQLELTKKITKPIYIKLENDIFYANENVNFSYLQMLIARYQDQIQQLKSSMAHSSSITLLDKMGEQTQLLGKQLIRVSDLLKMRMDTLEKRNIFIAQNSQNSAQNKESHPDYPAGLASLNKQYQEALTQIGSLNQQLVAFRAGLDQAMQQALSSRQGLPGFSTKAWLDLGSELWVVPTLTFQVVKSLIYNMAKTAHIISYVGWSLLFVLELVWVGLFYLVNYFLKRIVSGVSDHEFGHINLKWLFIKLSSRNLLEIAVIGNMAWLFYFCGIPSQNFNFLINLALVWLFFKIILTIARLCLVETLHDRAGHDVRLYHRLKWTFIVGGIITALTVFIHQLPLVYEVKDLCNRLFLAVLLIASIFLLKSWDVLPGLILPHVDERHTYVKRVVRLLGLLIPLILLVNSAIGLFGFVNFIQTISWYESIFVLVLVGYLFFRGILNDAMHVVSNLLIRHAKNGWLWTEAFLKPADKVVRIILFFAAWTVLFYIYGWDRQSPVVTGLIILLHYHLLDMLNTSINMINIIELVLVVYSFVWAARWTREFVYRFLLSHTIDLGVRNSIAILSQYTTIVIGIFVCLRVLGIDFRALTYVAGAFAFGVGLGLRDLVNNFACGFLLLLERPLRVGDTVTINEYEGEVTHIGGRAVTIRTWDHMEVLVPNVEIFSKTFLNWTANDHIVRTVITIKINRHDRPQDVQHVILQVLSAHKDVLSEPQAEVYLNELTDGMIEFEVRYFINLRLVKSRIAIRSEVLVAIWEVFEKHGIQPPYPHHEIHLKTGMMPNLLESMIK